MPENDPTQPNAGDSSTSAAPTSGDAPPANVDGGSQSREPDGQYGPNYVYGADSNVAEWKKFKTPEELDRLTDQMYSIMQQGGSPPAQGGAPPQQGGQEPPQGGTWPQQGSHMPDADAWLSDPAAASEAHFNARIGQVQEQVLAPQLQAIHTANAQTARALASQAHGETFSRWGPEIDMQMAHIPVENRTFEMYSEAVKLVQGNHAREITQETLDKAVQDEIERRTAAGTIRSGDAPTSAAGTEGLHFNSENLGDRWGHLANIEPEARMDFLRKLHPDLSLAAAEKKYLDMIKKGNAVSAEANQ